MILLTFQNSPLKCCRDKMLAVVKIYLNQFLNEVVEGSC